MRLAVATAILMLAAAITPAAAQPKVVDSYWETSGSAGPVDHTAWDVFLDTYTENAPDGVRRVRYAAAESAGRAELQAYLDHLQSIDPTDLSRPEQFAYWVNLYNAATVEVILAEYPVESIRKIGGSLFSPGPWREPVLTVAGRTISLDDIEHGILRAIWKDPRIHYAVNCASIGCPNLRARAFRAEGLEETLEAAAREYINHHRGAEIRKGRLYVSSIYDWFTVDFGGNDAGVIAHLREYAGPELAATLDGITRIAGDDYDWSLNDVR